MANSGVCAPKSYLECVSSAISSLETGQTRDSQKSLKQAMAYKANDPLAHTVLGLTLLMGDRPDDAITEFEAAVEYDPDCAEAVYGKGLATLAKGQVAPATALFCKAQSINTELDVQGAIAYTKSLAGSTAQDAGQNDVNTAIKAYHLTKTGKYSEALPLWKELQPKVVRAGFGERIGCSMTFLPQKPLAIAGWKITDPYRPALTAKSTMPTVSGKVALKADLSKISGVYLVTFLVDNKLLGITNQPPFQFTWDTTKLSNGPHAIKVIGTDSVNAVISEKTTYVRINNNIPGQNKRMPGEAETKEWNRLWKLMQLKPSAAATNYNLGLCASKTNALNEAVTAFERVMAADSAYLDASDRLARLYSTQRKYAKLFGVKTDKKIIALTFDDGPKAETPELLDLLKQNDVKATFFVVGKQAETFPDILKQIFDDGHEIQNHTYNHRALEFLSKSDIEKEIFATSAAVRAITGKSTDFIRPPGGRHGKINEDVGRDFSIGTVFWTVNCTALEGTNADKMQKYITSSVKPGSIILMHNLEKVTFTALPEVIDTLRSMGYSFVTLSELVKQGNASKTLEKQN